MVLRAESCKNRKGQYESGVLANFSAPFPGRAPIFGCGHNKLAQLILGFSVLFALQSLYTPSATAAPACPPSISPGQPITIISPDGVKLTELITLKTSDRMYRIPFGYLSPWPMPQVLGHTIQTNTFGIAFWMPSLRYPERDVVLIAEKRFCESGRPSPGPENFVIKVRFSPLPMGMYDVPPGTHGEITPLRRFQNQTRGSDVWPKVSEMSIQNGLLKYEPKIDRPIRMYFRHVPGSDTEILLSCSHPDQRVLNPLCDGYFYHPVSGLYFSMTFPRDVLPSWKLMVKATRDLLSRWCVSKCEM